MVMEANELMLDDFVYMRLSNTEKWHIDKVKSLNNNGLLEYKPILLTDEILLKNGFEIKCILGNYRWAIQYDGILIISKVKYDYEININSFPKNIKYVHELQHILRMFGLNETANNLKVK